MIYFWFEYTKVGCLWYWGGDPENDLAVPFHSFDEALVDWLRSQKDPSA